MMWGICVIFPHVVVVSWYEYHTCPCYCPFYNKYFKIANIIKTMPIFDSRDVYLRT